MKKTPLKRKSWLKRGAPLKRKRPQEDGKPAPYHRLIKRKSFSQLKPKQRKPMKQRSAKRAKEEAEYSRLRKEFLKDRCACHVCQDEVIAKQRTAASTSTEVHHMGRRTGKWLLDTRYWLPVCSPHHRLIEANGNWARSNGYLLTIAQRRAVDAQGGP
jgi:hypothetical protein